jgi:hypothetical protein
MGEITATLNVSSALAPEDVEVTPGVEDIVIEPSEGCYLRSVTIKAIPATPDTPDEPDTPPDDGNGD